MTDYQTPSEQARIQESKAAEAASQSIASVIAVGMGTLIGGLPGGLVGAAVAKPLAETLQWLAEECDRRLIARREKLRIRDVLSFTIEKVGENRAAGKALRDDGFFDAQPNDRSTADEVTEGIILAAQREHEERKILFMGRLLANIAYTPGIERSRANWLIRQAQELTYGQLCILAFVGSIEDTGQGTDFPMLDYDDLGAPPVVVPEALDLRSRGILGVARLPGSLDDPLSDVGATQLRIGGVGRDLYALMELHRVESAHVAEVTDPWARRRLRGFEQPYLTGGDLVRIFRDAFS